MIARVPLKVTRRFWIYVLILATKVSVVVVVLALALLGVFKLIG